LEWGSYAIYWEDREGDSGPAESDMSACDKYLEVMLPVDDLKGASRAIAPDLARRGDREAKVCKFGRHSNRDDAIPDDKGATDSLQVRHGVQIAGFKEPQATVTGGTQGWIAGVESNGGQPRPSGSS
jgi:hypothetical protein